MGMRELAAVTEAGAALDQAWARQAIDALLALKDAADAARAAGHDTTHASPRWQPLNPRHRLGQPALHGLEDLARA